MPLWEKKFCATIGSVPWGKLLEGKRYMYLHDNVIKWDDSAVKEAFDNAKNRFWAEINGFPFDIPLPDPNMYLDDVDWDASVDPELFLDLEREAQVSSSEEKGEEVVILGSSLILNQSYSGPGWGPTGWGDEEEKEEVTKPYEPNYAADGWESNQHENNETNSWEKYFAPPVEPAKEYGWQNSRNDYRGWNEWEQYGGGLHNKFQERNGGNGNWGTWDGYNGRRENMSWSKTPEYHNGNEYRMNRGRRRNNNRGGGGRRGNFAYVDKVATPSAR